MRHIALAAALAFAGSAQAGAVYTWETVSASGPISSASGRIEFVGDAWQDGVSVSLNCEQDEPCGRPDSPVSSFSFSVTFADSGFVYSFDNSLIDPQPPFHPGSLLLAVTIEPGRLAGVTFDQAVTTLALGGGLWALEYEHDNADIGCFVEPCGGLIGRWLLEQAAVPLPGTLALLGLGAVVATARRRTTG